MSTSNTVWIVIAALVALAVIAAVVIGLTRAKRSRQLRQAEEIREQARLEAAKVERREALAEETAAKARAAAAEAEVKAAEAARLQERAATHQSEAATSREQLDEQFKRADHIDPNTRGQRTGHRADTDPESAADVTNDEAWGRESAEPATDNYRDAERATRT